MRLTAWSVAVLFVAGLLGSSAEARRLHPHCRATCQVAIDACFVAGGHRAACRRRILRECRHAGPAVCLAALQTPTTLPPVTPTTVPPGLDCAGRPACAGFCCSRELPICADDGARACCPAARPLHCTDNGGYCCPLDRPICGITARTCRRT